MKYISKLLAALDVVTSSAEERIITKEQNNDGEQNTESVINQEQDVVQLNVNEQDEKVAVSASSSVESYSKNVTQSSSNSTAMTHASSHSNNTSHVGIAITKNTTEDVKQDSKDENRGNGGLSDAGGS